MLTTTLRLRRLLSFISWVELDHPNVTLTGDGCFNPYAQPSIASQGGELAQLKPQSNITGCVPQVGADLFRALYVHVMQCLHGGTGLR